MINPLLIMMPCNIQEIPTKVPLTIIAKGKCRVHCSRKALIVSSTGTMKKR